MKYLLMVVVLLALAVPALAEDFVVTEAEYVVISGNVSDTLGRTRLTPDSIRIVVTDSAGTELFDAWFESADAQAALNGDVLTFFDQWEDINGAASVGVFSIMATIASDGQNNVDLYSNYNYTLRGVTIGVEATFNEVLLASDTAQSILAEVVNIDAWNPITDNDSLVVDQSTLSARPAIGDTIGRTASTFDNTSDSVIVDGSSLAATDGAITATTIAPDAVGSSELAATAALEIADSTWDEVLTGAAHNVPTSAGRRLRGIGSDVISAGTAQRATATSIVLAAAESEADEFYVGHIVKIIAGTGLHQVRGVEHYTGSTDSVTLHVGEDWTTTPDGSSVYELVSSHAVEIAHIHDAPNAGIADTIFGRDSADVNAGAATSYGTLMMKPAYVQGAAAGVDSALISNLLHRIVWGTAVGSGADSSTLAQRDATIAALVNDVITAASIANNAFDASAIANNAIDASSIAADATDEIAHATWGHVADTAWAAGSIGDSAKGWGATSAGGTDTANFKTMLSNNPTIAGGESDMTRISGDAGAADNLETMLDGTGGGTFDLAQLAIRATSAEDTAFIAIGADNGHGAFIAGVGSGEGMKVAGGATGRGVEITGGTIGLHISATGSNPGVSIQGSGTGDGIYVISGPGATGDGIYAEAFSTNGNGITAIGNGTGLDFNAEFIVNDTNVSGDTLARFKDSTEFQGSASGLSKEDVANTVLDSMETGTRNIAYKSLVISNSAGNAVEFTSSGGGGHGFISTGNGAGHGFLSRGGVTGHGIYGFSGATSGFGIYGLSQTVGHGFAAIGGVTSGYGFYTEERGSNNYSWNAIPEISSNVADSVWQSSLADRDGVVGSFGDSAKSWKGGTGGLDTLSDTYRDALLGLVGDTIWQSLLADRDGVAGSFGDSAKSWKGKSDLGDGLYKDTIFAIDTSGTDVIVTGAKVSATAVGGSTPVAKDWTNSLGYVVFSLDSGAYTIAAAKTGYIWPGFTDTVTAAKRDSIYGYDRVIGSSGTANVCRVYGYVTNMMGELVDNAKVTFSLNQPVNDTCDSLIISNFREVVYTGKDSTGYFEIDLIYSSCLQDKAYEVKVSKRGGPMRKTTFTVPDAATYRLIW